MILFYCTSCGSPLPDAAAAAHECTVRVRAPTACAVPPSIVIYPGTVPAFSVVEIPPHRVVFEHQVNAFTVGLP